MYYANYLKFMERCRTDWLRALGIDQVRLRSERRLQFAVVSVTVDFLRPAVLNDEILVTAELERLSGATIGFKQTIMRGGDAAHRREHSRRLSRFRHAETASDSKGFIRGVAQWAMTYRSGLWCSMRASSCRRSWYC